jgi:hypothetical protein
LPLLADPSVGAVDCPKTGVAVAAASVTTKRKSRRTPGTVMRCDFIFPPSIEVVPDSSDSIWQVFCLTKLGRLYQI